MRKIIEVQDDGLDGLLGEAVTFLCMNYFYVGTLVGVNDSCVKIEGPKIIYETGDWENKSWKDAQPLGPSVEFLYINTAAIEAFGVLK